jgi:hypothetical protein
MIRNRAAWAVLLTGMIAAAGGCNEKITIYRCPPFWTPQIRSVAVVPFSAPRAAGPAGVNIADELAAALATNPAYKDVYNRGHFRHLLDEKRVRSSMTDDPDAMQRLGASFKKWGKAQTILVGRVTQYTATKRDTPKQDPQYVWNNTTQQMQIAGYRRYIHTRYEAHVSVTAWLIDVATGRRLHATPGAVKGFAWAQSGYGGSAPKRDANGCLAVATNFVVAELLKQFGVTLAEIKINRDKDFVLATGPAYDNKWPTTNSFSASDDKGVIVLRLPPVCDRNRFRITIVRKGTKVDVVDMNNVVWQRKYPAAGKGYEFSPRDVAAKGGGPGVYLAKFYAGPEPAIIREFTITNARNRNGKPPPR